MGESENYLDKLSAFLSGNRFSLFIQALILLSLVSFTIETVPDLSESTYRALSLFEFVTVIIFTIEYMLRLLVAKPKREFVFSFYGMIDLLAILPFYISTGIDLRAIRAFRFFRLFRILKIARYSRAIRRLRTAFVLIRTELAIFLVATLFVLYFAATGIYYFENAAQPEVFKSVPHSLWWAVSTLTTVGYGDVFPITAGGRIFTFVVLMIGLGIVAVPSGLIASAMTEVRESSVAPADQKASSKSLEA